MTVNDMKQLETDLEKQELEAVTGVAPSQVYSQLLAVYLYHNDLCNAKLLWKRIPESIKDGNLELTAIWRIGQSMWQRDFAGVHTALGQREAWSESIIPIMEALKGEVRTRALNLVGNAYSSLSPEVLGNFLGESATQAQTSAQSQPGWKFENGMILPCPPTPPVGPVPSSEDQLDKLTEFVAFLEN